MNAYMHVCTCTTSLPDDLRGSSWVLDSLELEVHMDESLHVNAGSCPESSGGRGAVCVFNSELFLQAPRSCFAPFFYFGEFSHKVKSS